MTFKHKSPHLWSPDRDAVGETCWELLGGIDIYYIIIPWNQQKGGIVSFLSVIFSAGLGFCGSCASPCQAPKVERAVPATGKRWQVVNLYESVATKSAVIEIYQVQYIMAYYI